jgi:hypothetical protein
LLPLLGGGGLVEAQRDFRVRVSTVAGTFALPRHGATVHIARTFAEIVGLVTEHATQRARDQ